MKKNKNKKKKKQAVKNPNNPYKVISSNFRNGKPTISVCLIVKNEERFLDNCLKSIKDIADEIIIIDTGSQDNTVEIAKKYTDKIYLHPWQDSYSEARNHYFDYATGDWIFQIDADEELVKMDIPVLLKAVKNPDIDAIILQIISQLNKGKSESRHSLERIFRNNGRIHYEGRIHERLTGFKKPMIYPISLLHYGYDLDDKETSERKLETRTRLLKADVEDNPKNPLPYHYLSCCYLSQKLLKETLENSIKAIELAEKQNSKDPVYLWSRYNATLAYYKLKDFKKAESMALSAIRSDNNHLDSFFILTAISLDHTKWHEAIEYGKKYLSLGNKIRNNPERFGIIVFNSLSEQWKVHFWLGIAYHETNNLIKSEEFFQSAVSLTVDKDDILKKIGSYYFNKALFQQASEYLKKVLEINSEDPDATDMLSKIGNEKAARDKISCCMIVKNEEQFLEKCLLSIKDFVDEIIIVDTGSIDSTVEIARKFTDKIYFHQWENSFGKARNQALKYAAGDWILQIDADELLAPGSGPKIRLAVRNAIDADKIYTRINNIYAKGTIKSFHTYERIFRNNGKIHYEGNIHEQVVGGTKAVNSSIELLHYGYDVDKVKSSEKFKRTTGLLIKEIEKEPENPMHHHNLSATYFSKGMSEAALNEAEKAIRLSESQKKPDELYSWTYFIASMSCYRLGKKDKARAYALKSLDKNPQHLDSYYILTIIAFDSDKLNDAIKYGTKFLGLLKEIETKNSHISSENSINEGTAINLLVGHALYSQNRLNDMNFHYKSACESADRKWQVLMRIGLYHLKKTGNLDIAINFLELASKEAPEQSRIWLSLAQIHRNRGLKDDEIIALEKVIKTGAEDNLIFNRLFTLYIEMKLHDKALDLLKSFKNPDKSLYPSLLKLGNSFLETGLLESAFQCYIKATELNPESPEAWSILAEVTLSLGKYEDAGVFLEKTLAINGNDLSNLLTMCEIKIKSGDIESHVKYCDKILENIGLDRNRTIDNFNDLKNIFIEIGRSMDNRINYISKINNIITELDSYITPAA